jgi:hypothetical protein
MLVTVVPEPSLYALALVGLACGGVAVRRYLPPGRHGRNARL